MNFKQPSKEFFENYKTRNLRTGKLETINLYKILRNPKSSLRLPTAEELKNIERTHTKPTPILAAAQDFIDLSEDGRILTKGGTQ